MKRTRLAESLELVGYVMTGTVLECSIRLEMRSSAGPLLDPGAFEDRRRIRGERWVDREALPAACRTAPRAQAGHPRQC